METIRGKTSLELDLHELQVRLANYSRITLDLGTGDGRYVHHLAEADPQCFAIGVDTCRENLHEHSRANLPNMLFVIASAQSLPRELSGLASHITVNFPWGSLLEGLLSGDPGLIHALESISRPAAMLEAHFNSGALAEAGWTLEAGVERIYNNLAYAGWQVNIPVIMNAGTLRAFPSNWARRLAHGRDPRAMTLGGCIQ